VVCARRGRGDGSRRVLRRLSDDGRGRAAFEPGMMVAPLLDPYARGVRSSRAIERACEEDVAVRVVAAHQVPDHTTIARFRQRHQDALAALFGEVLALCADAGLVHAEPVRVTALPMSIARLAGEFVAAPPARAQAPPAGSGGGRGATRLRVRNCRSDSDRPECGGVDWLLAPVTEPAPNAHGPARGGRMGRTPGGHPAPPDVPDY
jgi:hypothetical protein